LILQQSQASCYVLTEVNTLVGKRLMFWAWSDLLPASCAPF
jgi:hypothetical protein